MLLLDWRHHGGYRYLGTKLTFHQCEKGCRSPERPYRLVMLIVEFKLLVKLLSLIVKSLALGNMDMVVVRKIGHESEKAVKR